MTRTQAIFTFAAGILVGSVAIIDYNAFSASHRTGLAALAVPATYDGCDDCSLIARQMAWSLDNEPWKWDTDGYYLERGWGGPAIWVANQEYGVEIGTNMHTVDVLYYPDKKLLWRAAQRWTKWVAGQ